MQLRDLSSLAFGQDRTPTYPLPCLDSHHMYHHHHHHHHHHYHYHHSITIGFIIRITIIIAINTIQPSVPQGAIIVYIKMKSLVVVTQITTLPDYHDYSIVLS